MNLIKSLVEWIWNRRKEEAPEAAASYLERQLSDCDFLGKALHQYVKKLALADQQIAQRLVPALLELGQSSHPPRDFSLFKKMTHWPRHKRHYQHLIQEWWQVLEACTQPAHTIEATDDCCPINRQNLPAARAIIWLYIHFRTTAGVNDVLALMANCLQQHPTCNEVAEQLALSAANALTRQPFYYLYQPNIAIQYPILSQGHMGKRLQIQVARRAS